MAVTQQQIAVQRNTVATQNRSILSEQKPLEKGLPNCAINWNNPILLTPLKGPCSPNMPKPGK